MARANVPSSSFCVRPSRKRPVLSACFTGQQPPSERHESTSPVSPCSLLTSRATSTSHTVSPRALKLTGTADREPSDSCTVPLLEKPTPGPTLTADSGVLAAGECSVLSSAGCDVRGATREDGECSEVVSEPIETVSVTGDPRMDTQDKESTSNRSQSSETESNNYSRSPASTTGSSAVPTDSSVPSSTLSNPALLNLLQRYLPLTITRLQNRDETSRKNEQTLQEWLNEPDEGSSSSCKPCTEKARQASQQTSHTDCISRSANSAAVRPMDIEGALINRREFSTDSTASSRPSESCTAHVSVRESGGESSLVKSTTKRKRQLNSSLDRTKSSKPRSARAGNEERKKDGVSGVSEQAKPRKRPTPNAFVSLRIPSLSIRSELEQVQEAMVERDRDVKTALTSLYKLHVTLTVIRLENEDEIEKAKMALLEATKRLNAALHLNKHPLTLTISGLGSFGDRVLFAEIIEEEHLQRVSDVVREVFRDCGIPDVSGKDFSPHLTIAKMSQSQRVRGGRGGRRGRRRDGLRGLGRDLYAEFEDREFGVEKVSTIELLSMTHPPDKDHYYHCFQRYSFAEVGTEEETKHSHL